MHQPRLDTKIGKGGQVCLEQILELPLLLRVVEDVVREASIIMRMEDGFMEVLLLGIASATTHVLLLFPSDREEIGVSLLETHRKARIEQGTQTEQLSETHCGFGSTIPTGISPGAVWDEGHPPPTTHSMDVASWRTFTVSTIGYPETDGRQTDRERMRTEETWKRSTRRTPGGIRSVKDPIGIQIRLVK